MSPSNSNSNSDLIFVADLGGTHLRAATVDRNESEDILVVTEELMREIMTRNELSPDAVVSCIFTLTADLDAAQ